MSTTTTINVGESAKTITLPEGKALILTGSTGAAGVAYLLDPVLGGTNAQKSWQVGAGPLAAIGPYAGPQKVLVACSAGSIDALTQDSVITAAQTAGAIGNRSIIDPLTGLAMSAGGGSALWKTSGVLPDGNPVVVALGGVASSVFRASVNPASGDGILVETGTSAAGPWTPWPRGAATSADDATLYPGTPVVTHMRFTRAAGSGTTSRFYVDEISN
jgi:hypothetical protein